MLDRIGFGRLRNALSNAREGFIEKIRRLAPLKGGIDEHLLDQLEEALISGDVGARTSSEIIASIRDQASRDSGELVTLLKRELTRQLNPPESVAVAGDASPVAGQPIVIMVVGINGAGKTTSIGKLARRYVQEGKKVFIAAADTFRAAANEQLEIWAKRAGAEMISQRHGADPAAVAFDSVSSAIARKADVVIIDTAGRLHTKVNLMEELKKISRVIGKQLPGAPHEVLLVIDATMGQNALLQARQFTEAVGVTGIILTKLDGTAKGGIVLAIARELQLPVQFVGVGESMDDLQPFDRIAFVEALFENEPPTN